MRKSLLFATIALATLPNLTQAQQPVKKYVATPSQLSARASNQPRFEQIVHNYSDEHLLVAKPFIATPMIAPTMGKVSAVNPVGLGTASNALTFLRQEQNQVAVDNSTDAVAFIHRQDISIWGGAGTENGRYRYDISIDNGATFTNDIGTLQTIYTNYGRYPNLTFFNETGTTNPFDAKILYQGPTNRFPTPGWVGQVNGISSVVNSGSPTATEHYQFDGQKVLLPGGLCQGLPGEFWSVEFSYDGTNLLDSIRLLKGVYNSGTSDVDWSLFSLIDPGYDKSFDGSIASVGPNIAFSPDGTTGYIGIVSNVVNGTNTNNETLLPVFWKSTDGGATWGNAMEVDLDAIPWIADSLQTLWIDSTGAPASDGRALATFDYDMTVDSRGNVHMGVVIGTGAGGFAISSSLAKFLGDVTTVDGGATWDVTYLSPVLTFRGTYGSGSAPITVDNSVQVSRDESGDYVFFTWADSDTSVMTGSMNGIGFGVATNDAPNLRAVAKDIANNLQTYPQLITDGDLIWEGRVLSPSMAPIVVTNGSTVELPVVVLDLLTNDPNQPSKFWYFGKDVTFDLSDPSIWCYQPLMHLDWLSISTPGVINVCAVATDGPIGSSDITLYDWYPNPTAGVAKIGFDLPAVTNVKMVLHNIYGQEVATLAQGELAAGNHIVEVQTDRLASGVYYCQLQANEKSYSKKLVVTK
jgi:Secretion system C-terminal sorting domain